MSYTRVGELTARSRGNGYQIVYKGGERIAEIRRNDGGWHWARRVHDGYFEYAHPFSTVRLALDDLALTLAIERWRTA